MATNEHGKKLSRLNTFGELCTACAFLALTLFLCVTNWSRPEQRLGSTVFKSLPMVWQRTLYRSLAICFMAFLGTIVFRACQRLRADSRTGDGRGNSGASKAVTSLDLTDTGIILLALLLMGVIVIAATLGKAGSWCKYPFAGFFALASGLCAVNAARGIIYNKVHGKSRVFYRSSDPTAFRDVLVASIFGSIFALTLALLVLFLVP